MRANWLEVFWPTICQHPAFETPPEIFNWVQFRPIGQDSIEFPDPVSSANEIIHHSAAVTRKSVPVHHTFSRQSTRQMFERNNGVQLFDGAR